MPNRRRSSRPKSTPKLFECKGHGNCNMVFTRSEHLARHKRKHTGEKPYGCIVSGCNRMFSRFDNMMQHTQTHNKRRKSSSNHCSITNSKKVSTKKEPKNIQILSEKVEPISMIESRTLPLPTTSNVFLPTLSQTIEGDSSMIQNSTYHHNYSWLTKNYEYQYPILDSGFDNYTRRSSISTLSSDFSLSPVTKEDNVRRISVDDLRLPIEDFKNIQSEENKSIHYFSYPQNTIDLTFDEFEALEAFSKIRSTHTLDISSPESTPSPKFDSHVPHLASQVYNMRQKFMSLNESYLRVK